MRYSLLLFFALVSSARGGTQYGSNQNQSVLSSTSGVIGSVSNGNSAGKTIIFISSNATTAVSGATVVLSSRTTTLGKTFYLQHIDVVGIPVVQPVVTAYNMGSVAIFAPTIVRIASMTFVSASGGLPPWTWEFAEPVPIPSGMVLASSVTANSATATVWITNFSGYEK